MNVIDFNMGFILFFAFIVWVFIANDFYLKLFFFKKIKKIRRSHQIEKSDNDFFEQSYGGKTVPQYIKDAILKSQDRPQLLSLYLASRSLINIHIFKSIMESTTNDYERIYVDIFLTKIGKNIYLVFYTLRWFAFICLIFIFSYFWYDLSMVAIGDKEAINYQYYYILLSFIFVLLMPYDVYYKNRFLNKFFSISVFVASIVIAVINVRGILSFFDGTFFSKFYILAYMSFLVILLGAYAFMGYSKFLYMCNFFELLKVNLEQSSSNENMAPELIVTDPNQTTSS